MTVFIKTHGRPDKQLTYRALRKAGYTGEIIFVVDDEDESCVRLQDYIQEPITIVVFNKQHYVDTVDCGCIKPKRDVNLYAWCACEDIAKDRNISQYIMADDDITGFRYRFETDEGIGSKNLTKDLDIVFQYIFDYMFDADIAAVSTGIPQMYFNKNIKSTLYKWRVPYTFIFRNPKYELNWVSEYEEDVITAINSANQGKYLTVITEVQRNTKDIGTNLGGMHEFYGDSFVNAQYGYIWHPSCRDIRLYKGKWMSNIKRGNAFPKLVSSQYKLQND